MKRFIIFCGLLVAIFLSHAGPVEFVKSIPENNSVITSWNFTLKFDITSALTDCEGKEVGLGYYATSSKRMPYMAILYKGNADTGEELGTSLTPSLYGTSENFKVNGDEIEMQFDDNIPIIPGQLYTIIIKNRFELYEKGTPNRVSSTSLNCYNNPIILNFIGGQKSDHLVVVTESTLVNGDSCEELDEFTFKFFEPVVLSSNAKFDILKDGKPFFSTDITNVENDGLTIKIPFGNPLYFDYSHTYTCILPANSILNKEDRSVSNDEINIEFSGLKRYVLPIKSQEFILSDNKLPSCFRITLDLPEDRTLILPPTHSSAVFDMLYLYDPSVDENSPISSFSGKRLSDGKTIEWDLSSFIWTPDIKFLVRNSAHFEIYDLSGDYFKEYQEYSIQTTSYEFTTPSVEEVGYTPMEFTATTIGSSDYAGSKVYSADMKLSYLSTIQFGLKDKYYVLNGKNYNITGHPILGDGRVITLYEVTDSGEKALYKSTVDIIQKEDSRSYWKEFRTTANVPLYEGKKYKLVIPEGCLTVVLTSYGIVTESDFTKVNYIYNPEIVYTFEGTMPATFKINNCSVADNAAVNKLYNVVWEIEGIYNLSEDVTKAKFEQVAFAGFGSTLKGELPVSVYRMNTSTYARIDFTSNMTGEPKKLNSEQSIDITLPAGLLVNALNPDIVSDEITLHINGADDSALETVNVVVNVGGNHEARHIAVKNNPYSLKLTPAENWVVESVSHDGKQLVGDNGVYTTEPLTSDAAIEAHLAYNGPWMVEHTTGIFAIEDSNIRVFSERGMIVVDGVTPSDTIRVYNVGGLLIDSVIPQQERVNITVAPGQIYIVTVNNHAAKVQL